MTSGRAQVQVFREVGQSEYTERTHRRRPRIRFPGTVVSVELGTTKHFTLADALGFAYPDGYEAWDIVDSSYTSEGGDYLRVRVSEEPGGVGRMAGNQLRTKLSNLLAADTSMRMVVDWSGIPLISSSFADEAIGKLFAEMGPLSFGSRVQNICMDPLVRSLIDRAIVQRIGQQTLTTDDVDEA